MALARGAQQFAAVDDVGPVELAGIRHRQQHLRPLRQCGQRLQRLPRQVAVAEEHDAARQRLARRLARVHRLDEAPVHIAAHRAATGGIQPLDQPVPQPGLPALVVGQRFGDPVAADEVLAAAAPGIEPVGAVELVLVEQVGQPLGELQAAAEVVRAIGRG